LRRTFGDAVRQVEFEDQRAGPALPHTGDLPGKLRVCHAASLRGVKVRFMNPNVRRRPRIAHIAEVVVVDVANVMGARADGWWRDRAGAALRLCREVIALARRTREGDGPVPARRWVLVLEGRAQTAAQAAETAAVEAGGGEAGLVRIVSAAGSGDDAIVGVVAEVVAGGENCLVVTADRELRQRCEERGAAVAGPAWLVRLL
jgi:8-oxo-dGTP diphosphatase